MPTEIYAAILGALMGAWITYRFASGLTEKQFNNTRVLADREAARVSAAKFRAAFAPALAEIYLARHHSPHGTPVVGDILKKSLLAYASAIDEFRPFASDGAAYQEAWEEYRKAVWQDNSVIDSAEWETDAETWSIIEGKINVILQFAKI